MSDPTIGSRNFNQRVMSDEEIKAFGVASINNIFADKIPDATSESGIDDIKAENEKLTAENRKLRLILESVQGEFIKGNSR